MFRHSLLALSFLLVGGCASSGNPSLGTQDLTSVSQVITEGVTTKTQVRDTFGSPLETSRFIEGGMEIWKYSFTYHPEEAGNLLPGDNSFGDSSSRKLQELLILFTSKDVVSRYSVAKADVSDATGMRH